jgi:hypothetical protein
LTVQLGGSHSSCSAPSRALGEWPWLSSHRRPLRRTPAHAGTLGSLSLHLAIRNAAAAAGVGLLRVVINRTSRGPGLVHGDVARAGALHVDCTYSPCGRYCRMAKKPKPPKLFWLTYGHSDGSAAGVVVIQSADLLHARLKAALLVLTTILNSCQGTSSTRRVRARSLRT